MLDFFFSEELMIFDFCQLEYNVSGKSIFNSFNEIKSDTIQHTQLKPFDRSSYIHSNAAIVIITSEPY